MTICYMSRDMLSAIMSLCRREAFVQYCAFVVMFMVCYCIQNSCDMIDSDTDIFKKKSGI